jgi:hypothetical protein
MTKQGVRDLNFYGPRRAKEVAEARAVATVADKPTVAEAAPPATSEASNDGGEGGQ